ncbi:MAG: hypothetical protein R2774_08945 [Saprospiraceae bacterium]
MPLNKLVYSQTFKAAVSTVFFISILFSYNSSAQSFWFGVKGGGAMNLQNWGNGTTFSTNRDPLFSLNSDIFIESYDHDKKGSLYSSLGIHTRGSSLKFFNIGNVFQGNQSFKFHNVALELGAKKSLKWDNEFNPYFSLGIRFEYTVGTNLDDYLSFGTFYYPHNDFVRKFNYGVSAGGGFEMLLSDLVGIFAEFSIHPDLSIQYEQPPLIGVTEPFTGNTVNIGLQQVRNVSIEFKIGIRLLRKVEYSD